MGYTPDDGAHGFRKQRSIVSNARPHVGADIVLNLDLKDFFPTLEYKRVRGAFRGLGYGEAAAATFARSPASVANGARRLPQGAPTSPAITNIVCRRMDARLAGAAAKLGFTYTRYADDLTFSGPRSADTGAMLDRVRFITAAEGFAEATQIVTDADRVADAVYRGTR